MRFSEQIYRFLLRAYPAAYRKQYAEPMEQLFRDRLGESPTFPQLAAFWVRTVVDWAVSVPARYWELAERHGDRHLLSHPARRCIYFARWEASSFSRAEITVEHLLLGILREEPSLVNSLSLPAIAKAIEGSEAAGRRVPPSEDLRLSRATIRAWQAAYGVARTAGRQQATPRDLAAAILREPESLAARLLPEHLADGF